MSAALRIFGMVADYLKAMRAQQPAILLLRQRARKLGFECEVLLAGCRAIDLEGSLAAALGQMREAGVRLQDGK